MGEPLFHLLAPADWPASGRYAPPSLETEGFVHCSFAGQVADSANRHLPDAVELVAVEMDPDRLDVPVRVEDSYGRGTAFPHVYGSIPVSAAVAAHPLRRDDDGRWIFSPAGAGPGRASPDR